MAEWVRIAEYNAQETFAVTLTNADMDSDLLTLNHQKRRSIATYPPPRGSGQACLSRNISRCDSHYNMV